MSAFVHNIRAINYIANERIMFGSQNNQRWIIVVGESWKSLAIEMKQKVPP